MLPKMLLLVLDLLQEGGASVVSVLLISRRSCCCSARAFCSSSWLNVYWNARKMQVRSRTLIFLASSSRRLRFWISFFCCRGVGARNTLPPHPPSLTSPPDMGAAVESGEMRRKRREGLLTSVSGGADRLRRAWGEAEQSRREVRMC